jgi:hypothetical protein
LASDPVKARAGRIGARARWGEPRIIRLKDVADPELRAAYLALHKLGESRTSRSTEESPAAA